MKKDAGWRKGTKSINAAAALCVCAALAVSCAIGAVWRTGEARQAARPGQEDTGAPVREISIGAVQNKTNYGVHSLLNEAAPKRESGDNRPAFRILEIVPHEACSVFPYLVSWGTPEEYDKHVPIGYEGLMGVQIGSSVQMFSSPDVKAKNSAPYTIQKEAVKALAMTDYDLPLSAASDPDGKWYRKTLEEAEPLLTQDGYFEYVGAGKGLYYIASAYVAQSGSDRGIRYETRAIGRNAGQSPQGELYVAQPAYYVAAENSSSALPNYNNQAIKSRTGYHYGLSFSKAQRGAGNYKADLSKIKQSVRQEYDYLLVVEEQGADGQEQKKQIADWSKKAGFYYAKGGNYEAVAAKKDDKGYYVRISDSRNPDGLDDVASGLDRGYFRLATTEDAGAAHYNVDFTRKAGGSYYANAPAAWSGADHYYFEYAGEKKGFYDVVFTYDANPGTGGAADQDIYNNTWHYQAALLSIGHNSGRYALTSTAEAEAGSGKPVYREKDDSGYPADYADIVTNISFHNGINSGKADDKDSGGIGVSLGGGDSALTTECGGFIFVPVKDREEMEETRLSSLPENTEGKNSNTDAFYEIGDRIYVNAQQRRYRYYCRDGFYNNEWFKLLCYANNPEDEDKPYSEIINGVGYDYDKTPGENLADSTSQAILNAFDQNLRLEIVIKTPQDVTTSDIENANLIYLSNQEGINGISRCWNDISDAREEAGLEPLSSCGWIGTCPLSSSDDISDDVLMTIYDECIWKRNRAIIVSYETVNSSGSAKTNLEKLGYLMNFFDEARTWAYFMPDQYPEEASESFSRIFDDASVDVYKDPYWGYYNRSFDEDDAEQHSSWSMEYFIVGSGWSNKVVPGFEYNNYMGTTIGEVKEGETKLSIDWYVVGFLMDITNNRKIWELLQNSREDTTLLIVNVLNARSTSEEVPRLVLYADEFDQDTFDIRFKVTLLGSVGLRKPRLTKVACAFEDGPEFADLSGPDYNTEYTVNVRSAFTLDGTRDGVLNPSAVMKKVIITAENEKGKRGSAEVWIILREGFDLN